MRNVRLLLVTVAALLLAVLWAQPGGSAQADAALPGGGGTIVFEAAGHEIFTMDPDGTGVADLGRGFVPALSPDGTQIAYRILTDDGPTGIGVMDTDGSNPRQLLALEAAGTTMSWSPDGTQIASVADENQLTGGGVSAQGGSLQVFVIDEATGVVHQITHAAPGSFSFEGVSWSPGGSEIAVAGSSGGIGGPLGIVAVNVATGAVRLIAASSNVEERSSYPDWSPDGQNIVFMYSCPCGNDSFNRIAMVPAGGGPVVPLTPPGDFYALPVWSPDGSRLLTRRDLAPGSPLVILNTAGEVVKELPQTAVWWDWAGAGEVLRVEFTQGIQELQSVSALQASLAGSGQSQAEPAAAVDCVDSEITQWETAEGGNGHFYQVICSTGGWDAAQTAAESEGGYLASITSAAEDAFVFDLIDDPSYWGRGDGGWCPGPFIGLYQPEGSPEPAGGWVWVSGEALGYSNWENDEPGDSETGNENRAAFGTGECGAQISTTDAWHDVEPNENGVLSYVIERDSEYLGVEFTQGIQELQSVGALQDSLAASGRPPVPIVAGKPAVMRIYFAEVAQATSYHIELSGEVSDTKDVLVDEVCSVKDRRDGNSGCTSLDYYFTPPKGEWSVELDVTNTDSGQTAMDETFVLNSVDTPPLKIVYLPICVAVIPPGPDFCPGPAIQNGDDLIRKLYPVADDQLFYEQLAVPPLTYPAPISSNTALAAMLRIRYNLMSMGGTVADQLAGWLPPGGVSTDTLGMSDPVWLGSTGRVTWEVDTSAGDPLDHAFTLAHETGHNLGLRHTNLADGCGAVDSATDWPYPDSTIQEVGFDVATKTIIPANKFDMLSYCSPPSSDIWISPFDYNKLLKGDLAPQGSGAVPAGEPAGQFLVVKGSAQADGSAGSLDSAYVITSAQPAEAPAAGGNYCLHFSGGGDYCFELEFVEHRSQERLDSESFSLRVPLPAGTDSVALMHGATQLDLLSASVSPPTVAVTQPDHDWSGEQTIAWTGTDGDGDPLQYAVMYSPDGGLTWLPLAVDAADTELTFDTSELEGQQVLVRVLASDGLQTTATSAPITLLNSKHRTWGDADCSGDVQALDALQELAELSGLSVAEPVPGCPAVDSGVSVAGTSARWGDFDCNGTVDGADAAFILRKVADLAPAAAPGCPYVGWKVYLN